MTRQPVGHISSDRRAGGRATPSYIFEQRGVKMDSMRLGRLPAAALVINLLTFPALAETSLPRMSAAEPVFAKHAIKNRPSICNGFADYGATVELTVQLAFIDPLLTITEDLARLFRPFFTHATTVDERPRHRSLASKNFKPQNPSKMVKMAARKRLCG